MSVTICDSRFTMRRAISPRHTSTRGISKNGKSILLPNRLESSSASNQIDDEDDESDYEQEVNQAAANVAE